MTALKTTPAVTWPATVHPSPLLGVGPFIRKEILEWMKSRRAVILLAVTTAMMVLSTLSARLAEMSARSAGTPMPPTISFDSTTNVLFKWPQWVFFFAIVFSANLFIVERERGT